MSQVIKPSLVFDGAAGDFGNVPAEPTPASPAPPHAQASGPALVRQPEAEPAVAVPVVTDRVAQEQNRQILDRGGVQCPYCAHAFFLPVEQEKLKTPVPKGKAYTGSTGHTGQKAAPVAEEPAPKQVMEPAVPAPLPVGDEDQGGPDASPAVNDDRFWLQYTNDQKIAALKKVELAEDDEHRNTVIQEMRIPRDVLSEWMGAWRAGDLKADSEQEPHL